MGQTRTYAHNGTLGLGTRVPGAAFPATPRQPPARIGQNGGSPQMFTKCAVCHRWDNCPFCGTCHHCRPDVAAACAAVRATDAAVIGQKGGHHPRKRESTPYAPGIGQNGTRPRASHPLVNWYKPVREAEERPAEVKTVNPGDTPLPGVKRPKRVLTGDARRRALYGG